MLPDMTREIRAAAGMPEAPNDCFPALLSLKATPEAQRKGVVRLHNAAHWCRRIHLR